MSPRIRAALLLLLLFGGCLCAVQASTPAPSPPASTQQTATPVTEMSPIAKATSVGPTVSGGATTVPSTTETTSHT
ncbi:MAG TPA: hypothetical protein PLI31_09420, partial [Methanoregulaceae archaeon]|nr:hypothetical protein [Methanoregulaceae archaeon]